MRINPQLKIIIRMSCAVRSTGEGEKSQAGRCLQAVISYSAKLPCKSSQKEQEESHSGYRNVKQRAPIYPLTMMANI